MTQPKQAADTVRQTLASRGDQATAASQEAYMKGVVRYHGLKTPLLREVTKELAPLWKLWLPAQKIELAWLLLESEFFEEKDIGIGVLKGLKTGLDEAWLTEMEARFERIVTGWATCDTLCGSVFRRLLPDASLRRRIVSWKDSPVPWLQRAAAVSFVNEARHGAYNAEILEICRAVVRNPHRFVQLGAGWVLRELSLVDRGLVLGFLTEHAAFISAEGRRYALEKMPS